MCRGDGLGCAGRLLPRRTDRSVPIILLFLFCNRKATLVPQDLGGGVFRSRNAEDQKTGPAYWTHRKSRSRGPKRRGTVWRVPSREGDMVSSVSGRQPVSSPIRPSQSAVATVTIVSRRSRVRIDTWSALAWGAGHSSARDSWCGKERPGLEWRLHIRDAGITGADAFSCQGQGESETCDRDGGESASQRVG
jgi:hypothetical protein